MQKPTVTSGYVKQYLNLDPHQQVQAQPDCGPGPEIGTG